MKGIVYLAVLVGWGLPVVEGRVTSESTPLAAIWSIPVKIDERRTLDEEGRSSILCMVSSGRACNCMGSSAWERPPCMHVHGQQISRPTCFRMGQGDLRLCHGRYHRSFPQVHKPGLVDRGWRSSCRTWLVQLQRTFETQLRGSGYTRLPVHDASRDGRVLARFSIIGAFASHFPSQFPHIS